MLETERRAPDRVGGRQPVVDRRGPERPRGGQLLVREGDLEAALVVLLDLRVRVRQLGVVAEPGDVHAEDVHPQIARVAGRHPGRQREPHAAALRQAGHDPAREPVVPEPADRPDQRVAVRGERERPVDDLLDPDRRHRRDVLRGDGHLGRDPVQVRLEELRPEVPGRHLGRPRPGVLLVGAQEHPAAFLADVDLAAEVDGHRQLLAGRLVEGLDLRHVRGEHVLVLHGQDRQLETHHPADLARPQAAGVDDVLGVDRVAALDLDVPRLVRTLRQPRDERVEAHLRAGHLGALHVGLGDTRRVDVALDAVVQRAHEVLRIHDREDVPRLRGRDHLELHPEVAAPRDRHPEEVHPLLGVGQHQPAAQVDRAALAGDLLDLLVEVDRVLLEARDVRVAVERVHAAGRVPGGAGRELATLEQDDVLPARLRQVVEDARPDDATTDDDGLELVLHPLGPSQ